MLNHEVYNNNPSTEEDLRHGMQDFTSISAYNEHFLLFVVCASDPNDKVQHLL
jgi:hypothetical protein